MKTLLMISLLILNFTSAYGHQSSTSFLTLEDGKINHAQDSSIESVNATQGAKAAYGLWKVSINALNTVLPLDKNNDGYIKWGEISEQYSELILLLNNNITLSKNNKDDACLIDNAVTSNLKLDTILNQNYILIPFTSSCTVNEISKIDYNFYFKVDADHKAILKVIDNDNNSVVDVFSNDKQVVSINSQKNNAFISIVKEGIWHILIGFDHIIFLLTLITGVLFINKSRPVEILKVVTAFTVAHSITLGLAAFNVITFPIQLIEAAIAITLVIAALHNIRHTLPARLRDILSWSIWKMAFVFGLIHGFGFANVLTELQLSTVNIAKTLFAFNLGVELGQIAIVLLFITVISLFITKIQSKNKVLETALVSSSGFVIILGSLWFVERSFNIVVF